ncbi:hypothetical protein [Maricaulis sp.]|uniref:hypothetical protein n=1 Tax=Maricaulis sp. TaxID=1486257 RepID=UPI003A8EBFA4
MRAEAIASLIAAGLALTACQSVGPLAAPAAEPAQTNAAGPAPVMDGLGPQRLQAGECGVFLWRASGGHELLAFENLTRGEIVFLVEGEAVHRASPVIEGALVVGDAYQRRFAGQGPVREVVISGQFNEVIAEGLRLNRGVFSLVEADDGRRVIPVLGHYSCRQP